VALLTALLCGTLAVPTVAGEVAETDEVLAGFDDEDDRELEEVLDGFEEDGLESATAGPATDPSFWRLSGALFLGSSYNLRSHRPPPG